MSEQAGRLRQAVRSAGWEIWFSAALWAVVSAAPFVPFLRPAQVGYAMLSAGFTLGLWAGHRRRRSRRS